MKKLTWILIVTTIFLASFSFAQNSKIWQKFFIPEKLNLTQFLSKTDYSKLPDDNIQQFVGVWQPFNNVNYEPADLVPLRECSHISAQTIHTLREEAADNLEKMANAFYEKFWTNIVQICHGLLCILWWKSKCDWVWFRFIFFLFSERCQ